MHFVTLTSDWKKDDFYTGSIKGTILSSCDDVKVISLSNSVKTYNISEAAFIVRNSYMHFPEGSVHIIAVNSHPEPGSRALAAKIKGHFFIAADNGVFGLLGSNEELEIVNIASDSEHSGSFPALSLFAKAACSIINTGLLSSVGDPVTDHIKQIPLRATLENNTIIGSVIYIDSYGNAISNISRDLFERIGKGRTFAIYIQSKHNKITTLNDTYAETTGGDLLGLFNSVDLLEIAISTGSAQELLNLDTDSTIRVEFNEIS